MLFLSRETLDITNKEILYAVSWHLWRDFHFRWRTFGKHSDTKIKVRCDEGNLKSFEELFLFMRLNRILSLKSCKVKSNIQESLKSCERRNEEHQRNITMIDDFSSWNIHCIVCLLQAELATGELSLPPSSPEYSLCEPCGLWRISGGGVTGWLHHTGLVRWYVETGGERGREERLQTPSCRAVRPAMIVITGSVSPRQLLSLTTTNIVSTSSQLSSICDINLVKRTLSFVPLQPANTSLRKIFQINNPHRANISYSFWLVYYCDF